MTDNISHRVFNENGLVSLIGILTEAVSNNEALNQEIFYSIELKYNIAKQVFRFEVSVFDIYTDDIYDNLSDSDLNNQYFEFTSGEIIFLFGNMITYFTTVLQQEEEFGISITQPFTENFDVALNQAVDGHVDLRIGIEFKILSGLYILGYWIGLDGENGSTVLSENAISNSFEVQTFDADYFEKDFSGELTSNNDSPQVSNLGSLLKEKLYG